MFATILEPVIAISPNEIKLISLAFKLLPTLVLFSSKTKSLPPSLTFLSIASRLPITRFSLAPICIFSLAIISAPIFSTLFATIETLLPTISPLALTSVNTLW